MENMRQFLAVVWVDKNGECATYLQWEGQQNFVHCVAVGKARMLIIVFIPTCMCRNFLETGTTCVLKCLAIFYAKVDYKYVILEIFKVYLYR